MEDSQLEHRISIFQYIQEAWRDSGKRRSLVEILGDHTFGMTRDELIEFLNGSIVPKLEQAWLDLESSRAREEERSQDLEREREARKKAERAAADKDAEIEALKKALADARDTKATDRRDRFGSSSRKSRHSVDRGFGNVDRREEKENHYGTSGTRSSAATDSVDIAGEDGKVMTERELLARQARNGTRYNLSDASEKVLYPCDMNGIPEGWEVIEGEDTVTRIIFDTRKRVIARVIEFVKVRRPVKYTLEDGTEAEKWEYESFHVPCRGRNLRRDVGVPCDTADEEDRPFDVRNIPGRIPGTSATPSFAAEMLMDSQLGFMPVNRLWNIMKEYGFTVSRQTLVNWNHALADALKPAYERIKAVVLCDGAVLFCDETWYRLHLNRLTRKVYEWIVGNRKEKAVFYHYDDGSRGRKVIAELLEGRKIKAVHTDGYNAYFFLEGTGIVHITCAAHVWRYIMDWYNATKDERARRLLTEISALYTVEAALRGKTPDEILERRQSTDVTEILTRYKAMLDSLELIRDTLPAIGQKAVNYALTQYQKMSRWREDPDYEIDNNFAERSARPVALERKNRMHHASHRGAEASCVIRSVVETCRLWGKSARDFFLGYFSGVVSGNTDYDAMMPWSSTATC